MNAVPSHRARAYQASELELRAVEVIDLASQLGTEGFQGVGVFDPLGRFLEHILEDGPKHPSIETLAAEVRPGLDIDDDEDEDEDEDSLECVGENMAGMGFYGVAVQFGTPVREYLSDRAWRSGWGYHYLRWVYADTLEQAWELGVAWASECAAKDLAKSEQPAANAEGGAA